MTESIMQRADGSEVCVEDGNTSCLAGDGITVQISGSSLVSCSRFARRQRCCVVLLGKLMAQSAKTPCHPFSRETADLIIGYEAQERKMELKGESIQEVAS